MRIFSLNLFSRCRFLSTAGAVSICGAYNKIKKNVRQLIQKRNKVK
jgi:hypothetical protein